MRDSQHPFLLIQITSAMPRRSLFGMFALAAIVSRARPDTLASLGDEQAALFDSVAPAVVVIRSGDVLAAGFAVAPGLVLTAAHAVLGAADVEVMLHDGHRFRGEVVETSRDGLDVALVRIPANPSSVLELSAEPEVRTGSMIAVVGHGDGRLWSLATGHVSNAAPAGPDSALLALQVPLRPGASGGPVVDRFGRVIGVVAHGASGAVAFAVRSDAVLRSLAGLAGLERPPPVSADAANPAAALPLSAPELVIGPADPRPAEARPTVPSRAYVAAAAPRSGRRERAPEVLARAPDRAHRPATTALLAAANLRPRAAGALASELASGALVALGGILLAALVAAAVVATSPDRIPRSRERRRPRRSGPPRHTRDWRLSSRAK